MRLFGWVQNKLNGKPVNKKPNPVSLTNKMPAKQEGREEFSDWPHGLLAIGTFGNTKSEIKEENENNPSSSLENEIVDFTAEEVGKLQKELTKLLSTRKPNKEKEIADLPLDRFLNCPSSLEVNRRISNVLINCNGSELDQDKDQANNEEENIERTISVIIDKCKDICAEKNNKKEIGKKSISFLLKKIFVCKSGFAPAPSLRETFQESRMEKILKMMLQKKMNAQNSSRPSSSTAKKYIEENKQIPKEANNEDQDHDHKMKREKSSDEGCKWVKTDSEYIVLEI